MMRWMAAVGLLLLLTRFDRRCGDRRWLPFEDESGFGYAEWTCQREAGHPGDHAGWRPHG